MIQVIQVIQIHKFYWKALDPPKWPTFRVKNHHPKSLQGALFVAICWFLWGAQRERSPVFRFFFPISLHSIYLWEIYGLWYGLFVYVHQTISGLLMKHLSWNSTVQVRWIYGGLAPNPDPRCHINPTRMPCRWSAPCLVGYIPDFAWQEKATLGVVIFFLIWQQKQLYIYNLYIYICVLLVFPKTFLKHIWSQPHPNHPNLPFGHQLLHIPKSLNLLKTKGQRSNILKQICIWNFEAQNPQHSQDYDLKIEPSGKKNPNKIIQQIPPTSQISLVENDLWVEHPRQVPRRLVRPGLRLGRARGGWLLQRC